MKIKINKTENNLSARGGEREWDETAQAAGANNGQKLLPLCTLSEPLETQMNVTW